METGQRERSSVLVRSSAEAALRSMDRRSRRRMMKSPAASKRGFRFQTALSTKDEAGDVSADSSFLIYLVYIFMHVADPTEF